MKNSYRKLKRAILLRTMLITALTALIGYGILILVDDVFQDVFARLVIRFF